MNTDAIQNGIVNCLRLHVFSEPNTDSEVVCKLRYLTEVEIDFDDVGENIFDEDADIFSDDLDAFDSDDEFRSGDLFDDFDDVDDFSDFDDDEM